MAANTAAAAVPVARVLQPSSSFTLWTTVDTFQGVPNAARTSAGFAPIDVTTETNDLKKRMLSAIVEKNASELAVGDGLIIGKPDAQFNALDILANPDNRADMGSFSFYFVSESDLIAGSENVDLRIHFISDPLPVVATDPEALRVRPSAINLVLHKDTKVITIKAEQFFKQHIGDTPLLVTKVQNIRTALAQRERLFAVTSAGSASASTSATDDGKMNTRVIDYMNEAGGPIIFSSASKDATASMINESRLMRRFSDRSVNLFEDGMLKMNIHELLSGFAMNSASAIGSDNDDGRVELYDGLRRTKLFSDPDLVANAVKGFWGTGFGQVSLNDFGLPNEQVLLDTIAPSGEASQLLFLERIFINFDDYLVFFFGKTWAGVGMAIMTIVKQRFSKHNVYVIAYLHDCMDKLMITLMKSVATKKYDTFTGQNLSNADGVLAFFRETFSEENLVKKITLERQSLFLRDIREALAWRSSASTPEKKTKAANGGLDSTPAKKKAKKTKAKVAANPAGLAIPAALPAPVPAPVLPAAPVGGGPVPILRICSFQFLELLGIKNSKGPFTGQVITCGRGACNFPHVAARPSKVECTAIAASVTRGIIFEHKADVDAAIALLP